ncbi:MAG TPA: hypothetical protein VK524_13405 [Polyangiaceae bacterium]|nr:hypothetical protein [Polyangiaceae bacterium]
MSNSKSNLMGVTTLCIALGSPASSELLGCGGDSRPDGSAGAAADTGNAGAGGMAGVGSLGFEQSIQPKINEACSCHQTTPMLMAPFSLKVGEAYEALVGVVSGQVPTMLRVKPGSLNESYLWHKINGTQSEVHGSGQIMPPGVPLRADELDLFGRWIAAGAPR